jgi:hypothetical protein
MLRSEIPTLILLAPESTSSGALIKEKKKKKKKKKKGKKKKGKKKKGKKKKPDALGD